MITEFNSKPTSYNISVLQSGFSKVLTEDNLVGKLLIMVHL